MREHGLPLYLSSELNMGLVDLQHKKRLGRSYAGLLALTEGLYSLGCISQEVYEKFKIKYSDPLVQKKAESLTKEQIEREKRLKDIETQFSNVIKQWNTMTEKSRQHYIKKAKKYETVISNAKLVLALANGENVSPKLMEKGEASQ